MSREQALNGKAGLDTDRVHKSLDRLYGIYQDIAAKADEIMQTSCPYKNAQSLCTAKFGCRNQFFTSDPTALSGCTGSDQIDYRCAWET